MKKPEKELFESNLQGSVWRKTKDNIVVFTLLLTLTVVGVWKYEVYSTSVFSATKWLLLSMGSGFCLGSSISWFVCPSWLLQKKRDINHQRTQNRWTEMKALQKIIEENPDNNKAKIRLEKVEYQSKELGVISQLLTNPYKRV